MKGLFIPDVTVKMFRNASVESVAELMAEGKIYDIDYQEPCDDCISRKAAQAKIKSICDKYRLSYEDGERKPATGGSAYALGHAFDDLPPATPKRKVGEWIKKNNDYFDWYECSECGYGSDGEMKYNRLCDVRTKFCPDCGSQNLKGE